MTAAIDDSVRTDWAGISKGNFMRCAFSTLDRVTGAAGGRPANWRWIAVEKRSRVKLLDDVWHTAPNHSRPQPCVAEVDVDAED
jgi:hypothetical protein